MEDTGSIWDSEVNPTIGQHYDNIASAAEGAIVATAVDFGASVWNSTAGLLGADEANTADILSRVDKNALAVFNENEDAIHTASFIGGAFIPSGIALKGMSLARAGVKGMGWFSDAGKAAKLTEIDTLFREGSVATKAYNEAKRSLYARGFANNAIDAAAMEVSVLSTMNAHPFMEDYMKDPGEHFVKSMLFGGVLGGTLGHIADRFEINALRGAVNQEAWTTVLENYKPIHQGWSNITALQTQAENIKTLSALVETPPSPIVKEFAQNMLLVEKAAQEQKFKDLSGRLLQGLKPNEQEIILNRLASDPRLAGPDYVELYKLANAQAGSKPIYKQTNLSITNKDQFDFKDFFDTKGNLKSRVYIPEFGVLGTSAEAAYFARAGVLGETPAGIAKVRKFGPEVTFKPNTEAGLELYSAKAPELDQVYLQRLDQVAHLKERDLARVSVAPDDIPTLNALVARAMKNPEDVANLKIRITKEEPNFNAYQSQVISSSGVKATHFDDLKTYAYSTSPYNLGKQALASDTLEFLRSWTGGSPSDKATFRTAFTAYRQGGWVADNRLRQMAQELYESPASSKLRAELLVKEADAEGNVYLYRGLKITDPKGHTPLDSYTPSFEVAKMFAGSASGVKIYKVHVNDIVGVVDNGHKELEYMVLAPNRATEAALPLSRTTTPGAVAAFNSTIKEVSYAEAESYLVQAKQDVITSMLSMGAPPETIAIRTNTPINTVRAFMGNGGNKSLMDLSYDGFPFMHYTDAAQIDKYLDPTNRPLLLRGNQNKVPYTTLSAKADIRALDIADRQIKTDFLQTSPSFIARKLGDLFFSEERRPLLDMLRAQLNKAVPGLAGFKFLQSTDMFIANMGDFGKVASLIGKDIMHIANEGVNTILKPISQAMEDVVRKPVSHVEVQTALALNASLKGKRIYSQGQFWQEEARIVDGKTAQVLVPAKYQGQEFKVVTAEADNLLQLFSAAGREMYHMKNTANKIQGTRPLSDLGFWVPAFNPIGKHIAYVHDRLADKVSVLFGNTAEELKEVIGVYKSANLKHIASGDLMIVENKFQQELYNKLAGRVDPLHTEIANVSKLHGGSSTPTIVKANVDQFSDIAQAYEHYINRSVRNIADMSMSDITGNLSRMAEVMGADLKNQPLTKVQRWIQSQENPASVMRNTLLGVSNAKDAPAWQAMNQTFETGMGIAAEVLRNAWKGVTERLPAKKLASGDSATLQKIDYAALNTQMEEAGVFNPWKIFDDKAAEIFGVAKLTQARNISPRIVHTSNALAATMVLRFGDIAQPLVNAMSLPILTMSAIADRMPNTFMGVARNTAKAPPLQIMMEGVAASVSGNALFQGWAKRWEAAGYFKPLVSEASDILQLARKFEPGALSKVEQGLNSNFVNMMAKPADWSETQVRKVAMFTGGVLAKRLYPELDDLGVTIFARDFMDKAVGNYHAAQRPTFFQGTLGAAAGLFQTYMLTMGQRIYRHLQLKDYKALGKMMLTQNTVFGMGSLPGFSVISQYLGDNYSDDNIDLTTGTFRALPDPVANAVMYGLPSSIGPAFYSRGEIAPRAPTTLGELPAFNMIQQVIQGVSSVAQAASAMDGTAGRAMMQALSMQSVNRPIARLSELASGYSVTRQGNTIAVPEEVWTATSALSRLIATRPLEEAKLRDAIHLDRYYGSLDHEERQKAIAELKTAIRSNMLTDEKLSAISEEYLRTGSPQGWRSAVNQAVAQTNTPGASTFTHKLKPNNPLMYMIDNLDGED